MAEMKDLHQTLLLMDLVVDENRAVDQLTHSPPFSNGVTHAREPAEQIDVIEQGLTETGRNPDVVLGDALHNFG